MWSFLMSEKKLALPTKEQALPGRSTKMPVAKAHTVLKTSLTALPAGAEELVVGLGCFWGAERKFWQAPAVLSTAVGYAGGHTPNPTYEEVCSGRTGHTEVVRVVYDPCPAGHPHPGKTSTQALVKLFFESHDPTQGMRQGNDVGTQYRSALYWNTPAQRDAIFSIKEAYDKALKDRGFGAITTEIRPMSDVGEFYFAEDYHQQYLDKNPNGYCGLGGTGVACPVGVGVGVKAA